MAQTKNGLEHELLHAARAYRQASIAYMAAHDAGDRRASADRRHEFEDAVRRWKAAVRAVEHHPPIEGE